MSSDDEFVTCDGCDARSESGWGDNEFCLDCSPPEQVCQEHQRTFIDHCPLDHENPNDDHPISKESA